MVSQRSLKIFSDFADFADFTFFDLNQKPLGFSYTTLTLGLCSPNSNKGTH